MKPIYIVSTSCISPQQTFKSDGLPTSIIETETNAFHCIEPDFKQYINPVQIRRMSRALKIGYAAAIECMNQIPDQEPEAIIIGTGKGCLTDTEVFLHSIKEHNETALNATPFIHSTYNQLNGMIALNKKINSYNVTYVHRGFSFEHAMLDAILLFKEGEARTILVGSFDEMTAEHYIVKQNWGYWKEEKINSSSLLKSTTKGTIAGEGSAFFLLSTEKPQTPCIRLQSIATLYKPSNEQLEFELTRLLNEHNISIQEINALLLGENGDCNNTLQFQFVKSLIPQAQQLSFKHLCGEYDTASSFACWISSQILIHQNIPEYLNLNSTNKNQETKKLKHILIYNNYFQLNQSFILLSSED